MLLRHFAGAITFMTNDVGVSAGPNGPGTLFLTGGRLSRNTAIAVASALVKLAKARHGMIGASMRPSGRLPVCSAVTICSVLQLPCRIAVQIFLPTNDWLRACASDFKCLLRPGVTARNDLPSSNEKQMGQFSKKIVAPKASKPPESRKQRTIGFVGPSPRALLVGGWTRLRPGHRIGDGPVEMLRCCASGGSISSLI